MPGQSDIVSHGQQNTSLCSALLYESGLKPSLATTTAKASDRVIADPLGLGRRGLGGAEKARGAVCVYGRKCAWRALKARDASRGRFSTCILGWERFPSSVPSPGRSVTQARRLYESRLANFRVSDPRYGAAHRTCVAAIAPRMALMAGTPHPL